MVVLSLSPDRHWRHPCVNHTTEATKLWYRGGRHCTAIPVVERLCGACLHWVAVWAEALDNPCLAPSHSLHTCFGVAGRCGLQLRRSNHWHPQSMHAAQLTAVADILFN
jgi:hypothetical protein